MTIAKFNAKPIERIDACPLCGSLHLKFRQSWGINGLMQQWKEQYGFVPIPPAYKGLRLEKYECNDCGLSSYNYNLTADYPGFGKKTIDKNTERAEYKIFIENLKKWYGRSHKNVLQIGVSNGYLLEQLDKFCSVLGIDPDSALVRDLDKKRLPAMDICLNALWREIVSLGNQPKFKAVVASQSLGQVEDIKNSLDCVHDILMSGGRFYVAAQNPEQTAKTGNGILNLPPFNQIDFSKKTFDWIAKEYGFEIVFYQKEPLTQEVYRTHKNLPADAPVDSIQFVRAMQTESGHTHMVCFEMKKAERKTAQL